MIITSKLFHEQYGPGRRPDRAPNKTPLFDILVLTALADYFSARRCLEIGVNTGVTAAAILNGNKIITDYFGIDLESGAVWFVDASEKAGCYAAGDTRFHLMLYPHGSMDLDPAAVAPVDFVFIDGNHELQWVERDTELAIRCLSPAGGIICWHDYDSPGNPEVKKYIHARNAGPRGDRICHVQGTWICFEIVEAEAVNQIIPAIDAGTVEVKSDEPKRKRRGKPLEPDPVP